MNRKLPIEISDAAKAKIVEIKKSKGIPEGYELRLGVKSAGCGIASYVIGFDVVNEKDQLFKLEEFNVIIEKIQVMYLAGKTVDYGDSGGETGFIFREN